MRICPEDMLKDVFRPRADRRRAFGCLLPLLIAFHPQANVAWPDDVVIPEAVGGWEIRLEAGVEMNPLVLGGAPRLPSWVPHDIAAGRGAVTESEADGLDRVLLLAFRHGVEQVNGYLPRPSSRRIHVVGLRSDSVCRQDARRGDDCRQRAGDSQPSPPGAAPVPARP